MIRIANTLKLLIIAIFAVGIASTATITVQAQNQTQSNQTSQVITLLDGAQVNIEQARDLLRELQTQVEVPTTDQDQPEQVEIVSEANESAQDVVAIIEDEVTQEQAAVDDVSNATNDVVEIIEASIEGNESATPDAVINASGDLVEIVEEVIDPVDNSSAEVHTQSALIRLLTQLVQAQDYNQNLTAEEKTELQSTLQETIVEQATALADSLG